MIKTVTPGLELPTLGSLVMLLTHNATRAHRNAAYNRLGYHRSRQNIFYKLSGSTWHEHVATSQHYMPWTFTWTDLNVGAAMNRSRFHQWNQLLFIAPPTRGRRTPHSWQCEGFLLTRLCPVFHKWNIAYQTYFESRESKPTCFTNLVWSNRVFC